MANNTLILDRIKALRRNLDADWTKDLEELGLWDDVAILYSNINQRRDANIIMAYIAFAYHARSIYLDPFKDRLENKKSIMMRVAGKDCFDRELFLDAVLGGDAIIDEVIEFFINDQRDWRWNTIVSKLEFASKVTAKSRTDDFKESADLLDLADKHREKANKLLEEIREEYVDLDTVLEKEGKQKITDNTKDFMSFELYIKKKKFEDAAKEAEQREKDAQKTSKKKKEDAAA